MLQAPSVEGATMAHVEPIVVSELRSRFGRTFGTRGSVRLGSIVFCFVEFASI